MLNPILRRLPALVFLLSLAACGSGDNHPATVAPPADTARNPVPVAPMPEAPAHGRMSDSMLAQIIGYYENQYGNDSVRMSISRSDTLVELSFADTVSGPDKYNGTLLVAYISLVARTNPILRGDLDGDGAADLLVTVHTEGGGGGGNVWWDDHFVFLANAAGQYTLADAQGDGALVDGAGYFFPDTIANGIISGVSNEYAEDDGHCCPSRYYRLKLRLDNGRFIKIGKTPIPKPAGF